MAQPDEGIMRRIAREEIEAAMLVEKIELKGGDLIHVVLNDDRSEQELHDLAEGFERAIEQARPQKDVAVLISDGSITLRLVRAGD